MKSNKYTCIFGGGASRGISYIGAIQALRELEIEIDALVGSSVGAIFAALFALDYSTEDLQKIFYDFNAFLFKDLNFGRGAEFAVSKGDIFEKWIREFIEKKFYGEKYANGENTPVTFKDLNKNLYICTTDLSTTTQFVFSKENTPNFEVAKSIRISTCFPGLMKPVEYENKLLVDGDLAKSLPLWKSDKNIFSSNSRILEYRLEGCHNCMNIKTVFDYFNAVYSTISNFESGHVQNIYKNKDNFDYIIIDTQDLFLLDFQMQNKEKDKLAKIGYDTTINYFTNILIYKKQQLLPVYENYLNLLTEIKNVIKNNKVNDLRKILLEFDCIKNDNFDNADTFFLQDFNNFKKALLRDIKDFGFIPLFSIENKTEHIKNLQDLIEYCKNTISDFKEYIKRYSCFQLALK